MRKQRYNLDDLFQQMREERVPSVQQIDYAFLEPSGKLSIFLKGDDKLILPLIVDGQIIHRHLRLMEKDTDWLKGKLKEKGYMNTHDIFYCCFEDDEIHVQLNRESIERK